MVVHNDVFVIVVGEQIVPEVCAVDETIVEDEFGIRSVFQKKLSDISVVLLEGVPVGRPPWLVDGLEGGKGRVASPLLQESFADVNASLHVGMVNIVIFIGLVVPLTQPVGLLVWPVTVVSLIGPDQFAGLAAVVEAILTFLHGVDVEENLDAVFVASVEHPLDLVGSTIHASHIWAIWIESPVTNWKSDHLDASLSKVLNMVFGVPLIPMLSHDLVAFLGAEDLAEGVGINADSL